LRRPLDEDVLRSLLNSSSVREFAFKFAMYIDPSNVELITVSCSGRDRTGLWINDINEVKKLLSEVAFLTPF